MKRTKTAALVIALLIAAPLSMAKADNDVGCGVGTMIWEGKEGLGFKLLASMTNGMAFQSISITFGLINCNGRGTVTANARSRHFAAAHIDRIARDTAVGAGESLDALAALYEIESMDRPKFAALAHENFETLFPTDDVRSDEMIETLERLIREDEDLSIYARS